MSQHFREAVVLAQTLEILNAISAQGVQNQETLHVPGFVQASVPLFDFHMLFHAARHIQGARSLHKQRNAARQIAPSARPRFCLRTDYGQLRPGGVRFDLPFADLRN